AGPRPARLSERRGAPRPTGPRSPPRGGPAGALLIGGGAVGPAAAGRAGGDPADHGAAAERAAVPGIRRDGPRGVTSSLAEPAAALSRRARPAPAPSAGPCRPAPRRDRGGCRP